MTSLMTMILYILALVVIKVDEIDTGLEGAVFGVYDNEDASGDPIETMTSDENGFVSTAGLVWEGVAILIILKR